MIAPWNECKRRDRWIAEPRADAASVRGARIFDATGRYNCGWQASDVAHEA
jgi:hypothetical protein